MSNLRRIPTAAKTYLFEDKGNRILTRKDCEIHMPVRFADRGLGQIGIDTFVYGCFPIVFDTGEYSVCNVTSLIEVDPYKTTTKIIDEIEYYVLHFKAGDVVIKTSNLVKRETIMFNVFEEFIFKGKVPWFMEYEDIGKLFDTADEYGGSTVGKNQVTIEMIASMICRNKKDRTKYIRLSANSYKDIEDIAIVPLQSVFYSANSTINKLAGSYFNQGVVSSLVNPSKDVTDIESILRA